MSLEELNIRVYIGVQPPNAHLISIRYGLVARISRFHAHFELC